MYLTDVGYSSVVVGIVTGVGAVVSVIGQPVLAAMTQRSRRLTQKGNILILKALSIVVAVFIMIRLPGYYSIAILFVILLAIDASVPSMLSTVAMECVNEGKEINYGLARGLGSVIYAIFSLLLGYIVEKTGSGILMVLYCGFGLLTILVGILFLAAYRSLSAQKTAETEDKAYAQSESVTDVSKSKQGDSVPDRQTGFFRLFGKYRFLLCFLISSVLLFMGHNLVNIFLLQIVENVGGGESSLGISLAIGAAMEFPVMTLFVKVSKKIPIDRLLVFSSAMFIVKTSVTLFAPNLAVIYVAQFLQFGAFALYTPASVYFINNTMSREDSSVGQAMVGACTLGLGATLGNILGGFVLEQFAVKGLVLSAVILSAIGTLFMIFASISLRAQKESMR